MPQHGKLICICSMQQTLPRVKQGHVFLYSTEELLWLHGKVYAVFCEDVDRHYCVFENSLYADYLEL